MAIDRWTGQIDDAGGFLCEHIDREGRPAPATLLNAANAKIERPESRSNQRSQLYCPDCGTLWRFWPETGTIKHYVQREPLEIIAARFGKLPRYRRPFHRDIDFIIESVARLFPDLIVTQLQSVWPADDDGLWFFLLPEITGEDIQLESPEGMCPFLLETNDLCCENARTATTIDDTTQRIIDHLSGLRQS